MVDLKSISENLINGKAPKVKELVQQALNEAVEPSNILKEGLIAGMDIVGAKFKAGEFYIPEVLIAARAMHSGMEILKPQLIKSGAKSSGRFAVGTVKGDVHDIGKNLVAMMMEGAGFEIIDLGTDVSPEKFVDAAKNKGVQVIGMSSLLTTTMPVMKVTIEALKIAGLKDKIKTIIGGAPVTQSYADEIGADAYASDAASAVDKVKELLK
ncbi:MAG TPA: cobalamin-binding protein [Elusimicrobia bacterium]|nr:MAG: methyltransferase [Elusimicrobia bacterium RIFOXYD2_FULL_34_30]HAM39381.1 cobalamin-binding protein [Elusimicrobiota bacterium]